MYIIIIIYRHLFYTVMHTSQNIKIMHDYMHLCNTHMLAKIQQYTRKPILQIISNCINNYYALKTNMAIYIPLGNGVPEEKYRVLTVYLLFMQFKQVHCGSTINKSVKSFLWNSL